MTSFSIVICTWNRAVSLRRTLESLASMTVAPRTDWRVLVVDNGSTDRTQDVIAEFSGRLPIRSIVEARPGLSNARNAALETVSSDYLIWTDDDVAVDQHFLSAYAEAVRDHPDVDLFGGAILPRFEGAAPSWLDASVERSPTIAAMHVVKDPSRTAPRILAGQRHTYPYGANMMFRRTALAGLRFDPALGRIGSAMLHGEETEIMDHLLGASQSDGLFVSSAIVHHIIPSERQSLAFVRAHAIGTGRTAVRRGNPDGSGVGLMGIPFWLVASWLRNGLKSRFGRLTGAPNWLDDYVESAANSGAIRELWRRRTENL